MSSVRAYMMCQCECIFVFLRLVLYSVVITGITSNSYSHHVNAIQWDHAVDLNDDYRVLWNIVGQEITFEVQVRTLGYVGLGFSLDGKLPGSDVAIGWVSQGQAYFQVSARIDYFHFTFLFYFLSNRWHLLPITCSIYPFIHEALMTNSHTHRNTMRTCPFMHEQNETICAQRIYHDELLLYLLLLLLFVVVECWETKWTDMESFVSVESPWNDYTK